MPQMSAAKSYYKGGFQATMTREEAARILGVRLVKRERKRERERKKEKERERKRKKEKERKKERKRVIIKRWIPGYYDS